MKQLPIANVKSYGGFKVDHALNFNKHVTSLCKKASQKPYVLLPIAYSMTFLKED